MQAKSMLAGIKTAVLLVFVTFACDEDGYFNQTTGLPLGAISVSADDDEPQLQVHSL
jgi:hypothetical protein